MPADPNHPTPSPEPSSADGPPVAREGPPPGSPGAPAPPAGAGGAAGGAEAVPPSEARLRRIVESNMIGVMFWKLDGSTTFANGALLRLLGYDDTEQDGKSVNWRAITPPEWDPVDAWAIQQIRRHGVAPEVEKEYVRRDGRRVPVLLSSALFDGSGDEGVTLVTDLTSRKAAERAAGQAALLSSMALDAAGLGTWHLDLDTREVTLDSRARDILGIQVRRPISLPEMLAVVHPADVRLARDALAEALRPDGAGRYETEKRVVAPDGSIRWVSETGRLQAERGRMVRLVGTIRDDTPRREQAEALRASEQRFRATFDQAAVGMAEVDLAGRLKRVNHRLCEVLGQEAPALRGRSLAALMAEQDVPDHARDMGRLVAGDLARYERELRLLRSDGSPVWALVTMSLVRDATNVPEYLIAAIEEIQQRKEAEAGLVRAERHLRSVIDALFAFVGVMTPDGILVEANRAALEAAGLHPQEVLGRPFHETYWWAHDPAVQEQLRQAVRRAAHGQSSRYDVVIRLAPHRFEPIDFMISPLRDDDGVVTHLVPSAIVITERVRAQEALRQSEARLRAALAAGQIGTWEIDLATGVVVTHGSTDDIFGLLPGQGPRTVQDYLNPVHPDDAPRVDAAINSSMESGREHRVEYRITRPDGEERWISSRGELLTDERGARRLTGALSDITGRRRMEQALRESEESFRTLANAIPQLAWMATPGGDVFWYNQRWYDYTGTTLEQVGGWGWAQVHHPDHVDRVVAGIRRAWESGEAWEDTFPLRGADGSFRWFLSRAMPVHDEDGRVVRWFGSNTDITGQLEAAVERELLLEQANDANRIKSEFMAVMSHELRTPLNAIIGYADLLDMGIPEPVPPSAREYLRRMRLAAQHQKQLIEDILTFMRLDAGRETAVVESVDLADLTDEITAVIAPLAQGKGLALLVEDQTSRASIRSDARKLRQILLNLLGNAVKFTARGQVALRIRHHEDAIHFDVEDTGSGVAAADRERLFEPFWQADRSLTRTAEGSGLGLAIASRFAALLGGSIRLHSVPGEGSTFTLVLPLLP
jgi:PAS domain S-box-containing protein